jgi:hypothetical protein
MGFHVREMNSKVREMNSKVPAQVKEPVASIPPDAMARFLPGEGVRLEKGAIQAIVNQVIKYFEDKPVRDPVSAELIPAIVRAEILNVLAKMPITSAKMSMEDFSEMLRELVSSNTQKSEELARYKKSAAEWQIRAGKALEQAQDALRRGLDR